MAHGLEKRLEERLRQHGGTRVLAAAGPETFGKPTVKLMSEQHADKTEPDSPGGETGGAAE